MARMFHKLADANFPGIGMNNISGYRNSNTTRKNNGNGAVERIIDIDKIFAILKKNWLVISRDKIRLVPLLIFPFIMVILFGFTAGASPRHIPAAIADYDQTALSSEVQVSLYSNDLFSIGRQVGSQEEGKSLINSGKIKILFVIPKGFESAILGGKQAHLSVMIDESDPTVAQITRASTQLFVSHLSYQIQSKRIAAVANNAKALSANLNTIKGQLPLSQNEIQNHATDSYFKEGMYIASMSDSQLSAMILGLENSLGFVIDRNEVANAQGIQYGANKVAMPLLELGEIQQSVLEQIAAYSAIKSTNHQLILALERVYSQANSAALQSEANNAKSAIAYNLIDSASGKSESLSADANAALIPPLTLQEIAPYGNGLRGLDYMLPNILALIAFQGAAMGLGRAIAGERKDGSLTRVFLTPTSNITIITGTLLFYVLQETVRTMLIVLAAIVLFGLIVKGSLINILLIVALYALGSTGVGMVISVVTKSQEQYMALAMLVTLPMMFLAGVFTPIETMPPALQAVTNALPITYAADALRGVMIKGFDLVQVSGDLVFLAGFGLVTITLSLLLFKRELI